MTSAELIELAKQEPPAGRFPTDTAMGYTLVMRGKGYTFQAIHEKLIALGVNVHPVCSTFTSVMSRRLKRARIKAMEERR